MSPKYTKILRKLKAKHGLTDTQLRVVVHYITGHDTTTYLTDDDARLVANELTAATTEQIQARIAEGTR